MAAHPKRLILFAAVVAATIATPATAEAQAGADRQAPDTRVVDDGAPARRIISLVPALTEMLFAIGAGAQVIAVSSYDEFPPAVDTLPRVGALLDPDVERILALRPDLVITYGSQSALEAQLSRAGVSTFTYRHSGVAGVLQAMRDLGAATGLAASAELEARRIQAQLDAVQSRVRSRPRPRTLLVFSRQPQSLQQMYVSGGTGFLDDVLRIAGGDNVFGDVPRESVQPSHETLLVRAPETIVEIHATGMLAAPDLEGERIVWSRLASIPAIRDGRLHFLEGSYLVVPGPRMGLAAEALARALHPEAFE
ncbi:MAG: helical backbone metal receptor [Acidobacteria bacterium]|nr:helical backbone metal receptor [Acidobacteriota bacterium]